MTFKKIVFGFVMFLCLLSSNVFAEHPTENKTELIVDAGAIKPYNSLWYADMFFDRLKINYAKLTNPTEAYHTILEVQEERTAELVDVVGEVRLNYIDMIVKEREEYLNETIEYANNIPDLEQREEALHEIEEELQRQNNVLAVTKKVFQVQKQERIRISNTPKQIPSQAIEGGVPTDEQLDQIIDNLDNALGNSQLEEEKVDEILTNIEEKLNQASQNQGQGQANNPNNQGGNN